MTCSLCDLTIKSETGQHSRFLFQKFLVVSQLQDLLKSLYRKKSFLGLEFWFSKITIVYLFAGMVVHIWRIYWRIRGSELG